MQITREDLNPCTVQLKVTCDPEQVREGYSKAFKQAAKSIRLPGFRPGHAPKALVEQYVDRSALNEMAAENIVRRAFDSAIKEEKLELDPGSRPSVELTKLDPDEETCEFTAKVGLPPKIELGDYKGLPVEQPALEVTDEEIDYQLEEIRKRRSTREAVTGRGVQEGDVAVVNIKIDGESGEGRNFMTIAGQTFPGLDEALMGMQVEEMKSIELSFPETFQDKDWAGSTKHCQVTLNSVSAVTVPELDDAFAQSLKTENVEDLKGRVRQQLTSAKEDMIREIVNEQLLEKLQERSTVHVADNMWEAIAERRLAETEEEQRKEGKTLEQYAAENGMTVEALGQALRDKAKMHVVRALLIREIFVKEDMKLTNEDLNQELFVMAQDYGVEVQEMLDLLRKNEALDELQFRAISRKVSEFLIENADKKEVAMSAGS